jgi:Glycosyl transferases group 1
MTSTLAAQPGRPPSLNELRRDIYLLDAMTFPADWERPPRLYSNLNWPATTTPWNATIAYVCPARVLPASLARSPGLFGKAAAAANDLASAVKLLWSSRRRDSVGLVRAFDRSALLFCLMRSVVWRRRGTVLLFGFFLPRVAPWKMRLFRRAMLGTTVCLTWSRREVETYSRELGLPRDKFLFLPYKSNHSADPRSRSFLNGDYVFSGGNSERDYAVLCEAVKDTDIPVVISRTNERVTAGLVIPENVIVVSAVEPHFQHLMEGSRAVVVALRKNILRGSGQASFLNAMWHGRPTILVDDVNGDDYIEDGVDGFVVPAGDAEALRKRIMEIWNSPSRAQGIGEAGRRKVEGRFTHRHWVQRILKLAVAVHLSEPGTG